MSHYHSLPACPRCGLRDCGCDMIGEQPGIFHADEPGWWEKLLSWLLFAAFMFGCYDLIVDGWPAWLKHLFYKVTR